MTRQKEQEDSAEKNKNKRGDRKGESNNSPEIPDRSQTSDIPGFPSGDAEKETGVFVLMRCVCIQHRVVLLYYVRICLLI